MASIKKYKVISPKGFLFAGKVKPKGETFHADSASAHIGTGLHFKQIEEAPEEVETHKDSGEDREDPEKPDKPENKEGGKSKK